MDRPEPTNQHGHRFEADGRVGDDPTAHAPEPWGIRRLRVAQPPRAGRPRRGAPAAVPSQSAGPAVDPDPVTMQLFAGPPPEPHRVVPPPPTAWRTVSTVSVLRSILPPTELAQERTQPDPRVASELRAAMLQAQAMPVEEAPPATTVAVVPWPADTVARTESAGAPRTAAGTRGLRRRALLIFLSLVGAAVSSNRPASAAEGRREEPQDPSSSGANASARKGDGAAGS
jgi:hypothetical protein